MAERQTALRALVAAVPYIGGSIAGIVPFPVAKSAECRLVFMFAELHREMRTLDESSVREDFLETEEWIDLVRRAVVRSTQTSSCEQLSAIARILAAAATGTVRLTLHAPAVMDILAHTQDEEPLFAAFV